MKRTFEATVGIARALERVHVIGPYRVRALIDPRAPKRVTRAWLFYRVMRGKKVISDHGDRAGAILAAKAYANGEPEDT